MQCDGAAGQQDRVAGAARALSQCYKVGIGGLRVGVWRGRVRRRRGLGRGVVVHDDADAILQEYGNQIEKKIESAFKVDEQLIRIAGRWFPRALLVDVNVGNLNLAEAVLDMSGGEPLPASVVSA